jgi:tRNA threonylcarbamoyl adenosine modification protein YeaZ
MRSCSTRLVILSFDTATDVATACLSAHGEVLAESATAGRSVGAQRLLEDVHALLAHAGVPLDRVELIIAGTGPGTFTGLRIGLATARALGFALGVPVLGVSTLAALRHPPEVDVACIDARRGEVFCAGAGLEPQALTPQALADALPAGVAVAGDGAVRYRDLLERVEIPPDDSPLHVPHARHHAALRDAAGPPDPLYLRAPDADRALAARAAG